MGYYTIYTCPVWEAVLTENSFSEAVLDASHVALIFAWK
jgi:hypothetical protein